MCVCVCVRVCVCVCVCALFSPVKPESGTFPHVSILTIIILSIRSEEVLLYLVFLIHINTHNRMEINL